MVIFFKDLFIFISCIQIFVCICVCAPRGTGRNQRGMPELLDLVLQTVMNCHMDAEHGSSSRAARAFNLGVISPICKFYFSVHSLHSFIHLSIQSFIHYSWVSVSTWVWVCCGTCGEDRGQLVKSWFSPSTI